MLKEFEVTLDIMHSVINPVFMVNTNDIKSIKLLISVKKQGNPVTLFDITAARNILKKAVA